MNPAFYAASQKEFTEFCEPASNQRRINEFRVSESIRMPISVLRHQAHFRINNL